MGKLISVDEDLLKEGADPCQLWRVVKDIVDSLNDLSVTITPSNAGIAKISDGDVHLDLGGLVTKQEMYDRDPNYAEDGTATGGQDSGSSGASSGG